MSGRKKLSKAQYEELAAFRYALRQFLVFSENIARSAGITPQQHQALLAIKGFPKRDSVTVGELADRLQIKHHSAVGLIDRLVFQSLVAREISDDDRRQVHIRLTEFGEEKLLRVASANRRQLRRIGPGLTPLLERLARSEE
jgi:DNA-binding MarR family transcriptional regulator